MKRYILKEYGSWGVMVIAYLAGIFTDGGFSLKAIASLFALSLFINSKQAFTLWIRRVYPKKSAMIFFAQTVIASLIIVGILGESLIKLFPYALIPIAYILLLYFAGEHAIITEISGFILLTLSSLLSKFVTTGAIDHRLYIAVATFFIAGVFKVRLHLKRDFFWRALIILYVTFVVFVYHLIQIPFVILLPLIDNMIFSLTLYKLRLKTTGWLEVLKGTAFLVLIALFL